MCDTTCNRHDGDQPLPVVPLGAAHLTILSPKDALNERYPEHHEEKRLTVSATLKSAPTGGRVCLVVYDQGAGVRAEHLGKLFDPFFTTKPAGVGTGLGLGLCYEIVKRHKGEIRVESEPGHFTRVTVELPVLP